MTRLSAALVLLTGIGSCPVTAPAEEAAPKPARGRTIMFVDDHEILYRSGTIRVMNVARRHSETALISQTKLWEVAIGWVSVYRDPRTARYQLWYQAYAGRRAGDKRLECVVCYAESDDGITFTKPDLDLFPFKDHPRTNIVLIGSGGYGDRYCNELMTSRDGYVWDRNFRDRPFLGRSRAGLFDSRSLFTNSTPVVLDDEIRFYYGAYNQSPVGGVKSEPGQRSGVGLATIRRDRFAGLRPVDRSDQKTLKKPLEKVGQVTLKPLDLAGCREILVNADASGGAVRVELLTEDGFRVRGYSRDDAVPIEGDSLRHRVAWKEHGLDTLPAGRYLLRIHLEGAILFAVSYR